MNALAALAKDYTPTGTDAGARGVHLSGGTVGLGSIGRALSVGGHDDLIFAALQRDDRPSYVPDGEHGGEPGRAHHHR